MKAQHVNSSLEERFARLWDAAVQEFRFEQTRRWRADFAWVDAKILIEIEGVYGTGVGI